MPPQQNQPNPPIIQPQVTPPAPPTPPSPVTPGRTAAKFLPTLVLIVVVLIAGSVFAYYSYSPGNSGQARQLLQRSFEATLGVKSFAYDFSSSGKIKSSVGNKMTESSFSGSSSGAIDFYDKTKFDFTLDSGVDSSDSSPLHSSLKLNLAVRFVGDVLYINIGDFSLSYSAGASTDKQTAGAQAFASGISNFTRSLSGKWISIGTTSNALALVAPELSKKPTTDQSDLLLIKNYLAGMSYIKSISKLSDENVHGVDTYHLKVTVQHGKELIDLYKKILFKQQLTESQDTIRRENDFINDSTLLLQQKMSFDIWIGKADYLVYQVSTDKISFTDPKTGTDLTATQSLSLHNYNEPVTIASPEKPIPIELFFQSLFRGLTNSKTSAKSNTKTKNPLR